MPEDHPGAGHPLAAPPRPEPPHSVPLDPGSPAPLAGDAPILIRRAGGDHWSGPIRDYRRRDGDHVPALDPRGKTSTWLPVAALLHHPGEAPMLRLGTESGRRMLVTAAAALVTLGPDAELQSLALGDVVVGRTRLPVVRPTFTAGTELPLDRDRGRLAGAYLSEGHAPPGQPGLVCIAVADERRAAQVLELLARLGQKPFRSVGDRVGFTGRATCAWLVGTFGHLAHAKHVPAWALAQGRAFAEGVVEGYMGGDGCLWADSNGAVQVTAVSVSPALRGGMVDLLASLDVFCTLFDAPRAHLRPEWRDGFGLRVISRDLCKLDRWFLYEDRQEKLRGLVRPSYRASMFDQVPVPPRAREVLYAGFAGRPPKYIYQTASRPGAVSKGRVRDCRGPYGAWGRSDVSWDRVMKLEPAPGRAGSYGLAVDGPFAAGHGLLVLGGRPG